MKVGFTGTRYGMTKAQWGVVWELLEDDFEAEELHHGDCLGADAQADKIATMLGLKTVSHPPLNSKHRAWLSAHELRIPQDYLVRNRAIVDETEVLIATPLRSTDQQRSGTWYTIRYARDQGKEVYLVARDGMLITEEHV